MPGSPCTTVPPMRIRGQALRLAHCPQAAGDAMELLAHLADTPEATLRLRHDEWGRPVAETDAGQPWGSVSFSRSGGRCWGAWTEHGFVGLDVCEPGEFRGAYPVERAFSRLERELVGRHCPDEAQGLALAWAFKEAAVKATGRAFHGFDFPEAGLRELQRNGDLFFGTVLAGDIFPARAVKMDGAWLAVALRPLPDRGPSSGPRSLSGPDALSD